MTATGWAVLMAAAAALSWPDPRAAGRRRLAAVLSPRADPSPRRGPGDRELPVLVPRALAGAAIGSLLVGHPGAGAVLGAAAAALGLPGRSARRARGVLAARVGRDLPRAADLLAVALGTGLAPPEALRVAADAVGGPVGDRLLAAAGGWSAGRAAGTGEDPVDRLVRAVSRAAGSGAPLAETAMDLAADERERARWAALERARRAGVQAVGPLAACFLPAFVLLGVVPVVVGVARQVLTGWA